MKYKTTTKITFVTTLFKVESVSTGFILCFDFITISAVAVVAVGPARRRKSEQSVFYKCH